MNLTFVSSLILLLASEVAHGRRFQNAYVSFELPANWSCSIEGTEWICASAMAPTTKAALIVLTAKEVGPSDTFPAYQAHLNATRTIPDKTGKPTTSRKIHVKQRQIQNQLWIDGMHLGSEIPAYYTRYLATIKDKIAILVTFSAYQSEFAKYSSDFLRAIDSLRVVASKDLLLQRPMAGGSSQESIGANIADLAPSPDFEVNVDEEVPKSGSPGEKIIWLGLILLIATVAYMVLKKNKKTKKRRPKPQS